MGPDGNACGRQLGNWGVQKIMRGTVDHKQHHKVLDDMSRSPYISRDYFTVVLTYEERFFLNIPMGRPIRPGHEVEALTIRGGRDIHDTVAFRNLTAGTSSRPGIWFMAISALVLAATLVGCAVLIAASYMDLGKWLMVGVISGTLLTLFLVARGRYRHGMKYLRALTAYSITGHEGQESNNRRL